MIKTIKIGDHDVEMRADGATPYLYKTAFGGDLFSFFTDQSKRENRGDIADMATNVAYVMARQAETPNPREIKLSEGDMLEWLSQFEPLDVTLAADDVLELYISTTSASSKIKKNSGQQNET